MLTVADRTNKRLQHFTLDGKHIGFGSGVSSPCHFNTRKGKMVIPDLDARVTLMDEKNNVITHSGRAGGSEGCSSAAHERARSTFGPASSFARTARASITPATSTSSNGWRSDALRNSAKYETCNHDGFSRSSPASCRFQAVFSTAKI